MRDYNFNSTDVEKDRVNDILMTQKHLSGMYNNASTEIDCNVLHNEVVNILKEEHDMTHKLYEAMKKRGWYNTQQAQQTDIDTLYNQFNSMKKDLGI